MVRIEHILNTALPVEGGILLAFFIAVFATSLFEKEDRAAYIALATGTVIALPYLVPSLFGFTWAKWISAVLTALPLAFSLVLFIPFRGRINYTMQFPAGRYDERDTMFSRRTLVPGSERFEEYYARRPGNKAPDNRFRKHPGLLKAGTRYYDPILFAAANSIFDKVVEELHPRVEGEPAEPASTAGTPEEWSAVLLGMARDWGAVSAGITELRDYHVYSVGGRGDRYGREYTPEHRFAIAFTVEMDYDMMRAAPAAPTVLESANQYLQSGMIAVQLAEFIRSMGFPARAHIDGNYKVICPLVARDAGLGEIGRMGLLMTPGLGPRCRIAVVTTDIPLLPTPAQPGPTTIDFCRRCEKCALVCPSRSIPFGPEEIPHQFNPDNSTDADPGEGSGEGMRWKVDDAACYAYWCQAGTDCGRCMIVCPYSHPDNWFHRFIRFGIRNNALFRRLAVPLDDLFYGKNPASRNIR